MVGKGEGKGEEHGKGNDRKIYESEGREDGEEKGKEKGKNGSGKVPAVSCNLFGFAINKLYFKIYYSKCVGK